MSLLSEPQVPECTSVSSTKLQGWAPDWVVIALVGCGDKVSNAMTARTVVLMRQSDLGATKTLLVGTTKNQNGGDKIESGGDKISVSERQKPWADRPTKYLFRSDKNLFGRYDKKPKWGRQNLKWGRQNFETGRQNYLRRNSYYKEVGQEFAQSKMKFRRNSFSRAKISSKRT